MRKALFLEEIKNCQQISYTRESKELYGSSAKYILMIQTFRTGIPSYILKCCSQDLLTEWCDRLTELLHHVHTMSIATKTPDTITDPDCIYSPNVFGKHAMKIYVRWSCGAIYVFYLLVVFIYQQYICYLFLLLLLSAFLS